MTITETTPMSGYGALYLAAHDRIAELVESAGDNVSAQTAVPACPSWVVKDVVAHVAGVCSDVLAGNIENAATSQWTANQVAARRDDSATDIVHEWRATAPNLAAALDEFPGWYGCQLLADTVTHEQDLRGALGEAPSMNDGLSRALEFVVSAVAHPAAVALGLGPLEIRAGSDSWIIGADSPATGDPGAAVAAAIESGQRLAPVTSQPAASLYADPRELARAFTGRRSAAQIRRLGWVGDPQTYLPLFAQPPFFALRPEDLVD